MQWRPGRDAVEAWGCVVLWPISYNTLAPGRCWEVFPCCRSWWECRALIFVQNPYIRVRVLIFSMCIHLETPTWMSFSVLPQFYLSHLPYLLPSSASLELMPHILFLTLWAEHWNGRAKWSVCGEKGKEKQFSTPPPICDVYISVEI